MKKETVIKIELLNCIVLILAAILGWWMCILNRNQHAPHRIDHLYDGKVIRSEWTTNPAYTTMYMATNWASTGVVYSVAFRTNYYWKVWSIFE